MNLEDTMLSEVSLRQIPYYFTYMWSLKTNEQKRKGQMNKTETDSEIKETGSCLPEKGGAGGEWSMGSDEWVQTSRFK